MVTETDSNKARSAVVSAYNALDCVGMSVPFLHAFADAAVDAVSTDAEPVMYVSEQQLGCIGQYIPTRKEAEGNFQLALYRAPPAPAVAVKALTADDILAGIKDQRFGYVVHDGKLTVGTDRRIGIDLKDLADFLSRSALSAQVQEARNADEDEIYEIGVREGYERAVQEIDIKTGGDGEYRYCTDHDPDRHTPDAPAMIQRIVDRFETLNLIGEAEKRGDFWDVPGSAQVQDVAVPEGWQLVPTEPTHSMIRAMSESKATDDEGEYPCLSEIIDFSGENKTHTALKAAYRAMLAASPASKHGDAE